MSTVNLSPFYTIIVGGEAVASFTTIGEARSALTSVFSKRAGAYIQYPIGALNRDHLEAQRRKASTEMTRRPERPYNVFETKRAGTEFASRAELRRYEANKKARD